jgi:hypothetical protein
MIRIIAETKLMELITNCPTDCHGAVLPQKLQTQDYPASYATGRYVEKLLS